MFGMSSGRYFLLVLLSIAFALTGVDASCDGVEECLSNYGVSMFDNDLNVKSASDLDSYCQTFESIRACGDPELSTCEELKEGWLSYVSKEQYLCSTEGRRIFLISASCIETVQNDAAVEACSYAYSTAVSLVTERLYIGYYGSTEAAYRDLCRATDDLYTCNCNAVRPSCGQDAATFYHTYIVKATEHTWNLIICPTLYGSPTSCNGGNGTTTTTTPRSTESQSVEVTCNDIESCIPDVFLAVPDLEEYEITTERDLSKYCVDFAEQKKCVEETEPCHNPVLSEWKMNTLNKALYVCSDEGRRLYLANSECLHSQRRQNATNGCDLELDTMFSVSNTSSEGDIRRVANSALHKTFGCVCAEVLQICGQEAATYYHTYTYRQYEEVWRELYGGPAAYTDLTPCGRGGDPTSEAPTGTQQGPSTQVDGTSSYDPTTMVTIGVAVAGVVVVTLIVTVGVIVVQKRRSSNQPAASAHEPVEPHLATTWIDDVYLTPKDVGAYAVIRDSDVRVSGSWPSL